MGKDRDDKFEGHDESEYHFSDEDVGYEVETEAPKQAAPAGEGVQKENLMARLTRSKRMIVSLGVFLVLVFFVYKMVAPTSSVPPTEIAAVPVIAQQPAMPKGASVAQNQKASAVPAMPVVPPVPGAMLQQTASTPVTNQPETAASPPTLPSTMPPTASVPPVAAQAPNAIVMPPSGAALIPSSTVTSQSMAQPSTVVQQQPVQLTTAPTQPQQNTQVVTSVPAVMPPAQSAVSAYNVNQPSPSMAPPISHVDQKSAALTTDTERLMDQLQATYAQKLNDYNSQNKALQDQVQTLNGRVANIETQLNQLVQMLTRQQGLVNQSGAAPTQLQAVEMPKVAYNVQAIIPGRAWLKSDNGETLTVAEGDVIKDVGRITKIDPYDGLVEINTGSKVISLSYGNGG